MWLVAYFSHVTDLTPIYLPVILREAIYIRSLTPAPTITLQHAATLSS